MRLTKMCAVLACTCAVYAQSVLTPVLVHKDGEASATGHTGSERDLLVDGGSGRVVSWITFQTQNVDFTHVTKATLALYIRSVESPGTLEVYALTAAPPAPENSVSLSSLALGTTPVVAVAIGSADIEKVIHLDITALACDTSFHGVAFESNRGLRASFDSKEGHLAPVILLTNDVRVAAVKWLSGVGFPGLALGRDGDYYLNTSNGDVLTKGAGVWTVAMNIRGPQGPQGLQGVQGLVGSIGPKGEQGIQGLPGANGISINWRGSGPTPPPMQFLNDAYRNTIDGNTYLYNGTSWQVMVRGTSGLTSLMVDADGNVYHTIVLGNQEWTLQNLRTTRLNDGTPIPNVVADAEWLALKTPGYCWYGHDKATADRYGAFYNWYAVNSGKLAPTGWRVPTDADWSTLENYLISHGYNWDGSTTGDKTAKAIATGGWLSSITAGHVGNDQASNNRSGFSAIPIGSRYAGFDTYGELCSMWSSTSQDATWALSRIVDPNLPDIMRAAQSKETGLSVRLVRDLN